MNILKSSSFARDKKGATAIEYAILVTLISVGAIGSITATGDETNDLFGGLSNTFDTALLGAGAIGWAGNPSSPGTVTVSKTGPSSFEAAMTLDAGGATAGSTVTETYIIDMSNDGDADITLTDISIDPTSVTKTSGDASTYDFVISGGTCTVGDVLAPGDTCTIDIDATADDNGEFTAELIVTYD